MGSSEPTLYTAELQRNFCIWPYFPKCHISGYSAAEWFADPLKTFTKFLSMTRFGSPGSPIHRVLP